MDDQSRLVTSATLPNHAATAYASAVGSKGAQAKPVAETLLPPKPLRPPAEYDGDLARALATADYPAGFFEGGKIGTDRAAPSPLLDRMRTLPGRLRAKAHRRAARYKARAVTVHNWTQEPDLAKAAAAAWWAGQVAKAKKRRATPRVHTRRTVLRVEGPFWATLKTDGTLKPNLLGAVAEFYATLDPAQDQQAAISVHLRPLGPHASKAYRWNLGRKLNRQYKEAERAAERKTQREEAANTPQTESQPTRPGIIASFHAGATGNYQAARQATRPAPRPKRRRARNTRRWTPSQATPAEADSLTHERQQTNSRINDEDPLFFVEIIVEVTDRLKGRAKAHSKDLASTLAALNSEATLRPQGVGIRIGKINLTFLGMNTWPVSKLLERHLNRFHMPTRGRPVSSRELAPLLGPATAHAASENVRHQAQLAPAPRGLPRYDRRKAHNLPFGVVTARDGTTYAAGIPFNDSQMKFLCGRTGWGKSGTQYTEIVHITLNTNWSVTYFDPEGEAFDILAPYLVHANRPVQHINLRDNSARQYGWNPLDMSRRRPEESDMVVDDTVGRLAHAASFSKGSNRAIAMLNMVAETLVALNIKLCQAGHPELQTTLFTIPRLLDSDAFRLSILPYLQPEVQEYWTETFPKLEENAKTVVSQLLDRLRGQHSALGAFLGQSVSTIDFRESLAAGAITIIALPTDSDKESFVAQLLLYDYVRAVRQREPNDPRNRRGYVYLDEAQMYDKAEEGMINRIFSTFRKRDIVGTAMTQTPTHLAPATYEGIFNNTSVMYAGHLDGRDARIAALAVGGEAPEVVKDLDKHWWATKLTFKGKVYGPCKVRGIGPHEVFGDVAKPELVPSLQTKMDGIEIIEDAHGNPIEVPTIRRARREIAAFHTQHLAVEKWIAQQRRAEASARQPATVAPNARSRNPRRSGTA